MKHNYTNKMVKFHITKISNFSPLKYSSHYYGIFYIVIEFHTMAGKKYALELTLETQATQQK